MPRKTDLLGKELQKANRRIKALERQLAEGKVIYKESTRRMIDTLKDKAAMLTNVSSGSLRIGGLQAEDREKYLNILKAFNDHKIGTLTGQRQLAAETKRKFEETYGTTDAEGNIIPISDEDYEMMVRIFESDQFQRFKEKFGQYSNIINEMAAKPKDYRKAVKYIDKVVNDDTGKFFEKGSETLNARAFIKGWQKL